MQNTTTETKSNLLVCKCGCGQGLNNTVSTYRPGHDAKHVSVLVSYLFTNKDALSSGEDFFAQSFLYHRKQLPSIALQNKFTRAVFNLLEKTLSAKPQGSTLTSKGSTMPCTPRPLLTAW